MTTITLENATTNLAQIASRAIRDAEETVVVTTEGAVVLIDQREWERTGKWGKWGQATFSIDTLKPNANG